MRKKGDLVKFSFLLIVVMTLLAITLYSYLGSKKSETEDEITNTDTIKTSKIEEVLKENASIEDEKEQEKVQLKESDENIEISYVDQYGKDSVKRAKMVSQKVVTMWLEQEENKTEWEKYSTSSFFDLVNDQLFNESDVVTDGLSRKVKKVKVYAVPVAAEEGNMKFELNAMWEYSKGKEVLGKKTRIFYAVLTTSSNEREWVVKELIQL